MNEAANDQMRTVYAAAALLVRTPPVELAAALRANGHDQAAEHIRYLGVAVTLYRAHQTGDAPDRAKIAHFHLRSTPP